MEEILTIRVPKGTRRRLMTAARARRLTLSQYVRQALASEHLLDSFEAVADPEKRQRTGPLHDLRTSPRPVKRFASWSAVALYRFGTEGKIGPRRSAGNKVSCSGR